MLTGATDAVVYRKSCHPLLSNTSTLDGGRGSKFPGQLLLAVTTQPNQTATGIEIII